nr:restriction endonuclease [Aliifodinibius sp. S!AR15-10]
MKVENLEELSSRATELHYEITEIKNEIQKLDLDTKKKLQNIKPEKFEEYVRDIFDERGYQTNLTQFTGDGGIDITLKKNSKTKIVQCKRYKGVVSSPEIRQFLGTLTYNEVDAGIFVTTGKFSSGAKKIARKSDIQLINGDSLVKLAIETFGTSDDKIELKNKLNSKEEDLNKLHMKILDLEKEVSKESIERNYVKKISEMNLFNNYKLKKLNNKRERIIDKSYSYFQQKYNLEFPYTLKHKNS